MKTLSKLAILALLLAFLYHGCEKDPLQPDKNTLRISKIARNSEMIDPIYVFEYNEKGLLTRITGDWVEDYISITYNDEDLPIKIFEKSEFEADNKTIDIVWEENSYTTTTGTYDIYTDTYHFDSQGRIDSYSYSSYNASFDETYTRNFEVVWDDKEMNFYQLNDGSEREWIQTRKYNENKNPMQAINYAILNEFELTYVLADYGITFQQDLCVSMHHCEDEGVGTYEYEYNEDGYPISVLILREDYGPTYYYFEYESD